VSSVENKKRKNMTALDPANTKRKKIRIVINRKSTKRKTRRKRITKKNQDSPATVTTDPEIKNSDNCQEIQKQKDPDIEIMTDTIGDRKRGIDPKRKSTNRRITEDPDLGTKRKITQERRTHTNVGENRETMRKNINTVDDSDSIALQKAMIV